MNIGFEQYLMDDGEIMESGKDIGFDEETTHYLTGIRLFDKLYKTYINKQSFSTINIAHRTHVRVESTCQDYLFNERPKIKQLIEKYNQRMKEKAQMKKSLHIGQHSRSATLQSIASRASFHNLTTLTSKKNNNKEKEKEKDKDKDNNDSEKTTGNENEKEKNKKTKQKDGNFTPTTPTGTVTIGTTTTTTTGHIDINDVNGVQIDENAFIEIVDERDTDMEDNGNGMAFTEYIMQYTVLSNLGKFVNLNVFKQVDHLNKYPCL